MASSSSGPQPSDPSSLCSTLLFEAVLAGSEQHVEVALQRFITSINKPSASEVYPLHAAVWRNHPAIVEKLLQAGAKPDLVDGESGWSSLHRALYFGNLAVMQRLLASGAQLDILDHQGRTPIDIVTQELTQGGQRFTAAARHRSGSSKPALTTCSLYSFGSGANYQLGTGSTDFHELPVRVEALAGLQPVQLAAAKFHSAAVDASGQLYTWGWGRGGRLGHPDAHIHSGERAVIQPWVVLGLGRRHVAQVAAAKHHMVVCTTGGEVFTWGSNRDGRLGYAGVDTQPTPRRVALLRGRVMKVAAANKHSACITSSGEVWTWGANGHGQLGYGTSDSGANPTPRLVEALKGKVLTQVGCAKRHTVVLTSDGEPLTWGHRIATPRRVQLAGARDTLRSQGGSGGGSSALGSSGAPVELRFHKGHQEVTRPVAVALAVGYAHTTVITSGGAVLTWASADPSLRVCEVLGPLAGKHAICVSASKLRTAVATEQGEVYVWEARPEGGAGVGARLPTLGPAGLGTAVAGLGQQAAVPGSSAPSTSYQGGVMGASPSPSPSPLLQERLGGAMGGGDATGPGSVGAAAITPVRVSGLQRVAALSVGEKHTLALVAWAAPPLPNRQGFVPRPGVTAAGAADAGTRRASHSRSSSLDGWDLRSDGEDSDGGAGAQEEAAGATPGLTPASAQAGAGRSAAAPHAWAGRKPPPTAALGLVAAPPDDSGDGPASLLLPGLSYQLPTSDEAATSAVPDLQTLAQRAVATQLVEPRTVLSLLEYGDACGAALLRAYCLAFCLQNLDAVLTEARPAMEALPSHLMAELEQHWKAWLAPGAQPHVQRLASGSMGTPVRGDSSALAGGASPPLGTSPPLGSSPPTGASYGGRPSSLTSGSWVEGWQGLAALGGSPVAGTLVKGRSRSGLAVRSGRLRQQLQSGRRPTAAPQGLGGKATIARAGSGSAVQHAFLAALSAIGHLPERSTSPGEEGAPGTTSGRISSGNTATGDAQFASHADREAEAVVEQRARLMRNIRKKLQQTEALQERQASGAPLDTQQLAKLGQRAALEEALQALELGVSLDAVQQIVAHANDLAQRLGSTAAPAGASASTPASAKKAVAGVSTMADDSTTKRSGGPTPAGSRRATAGDVPAPPAPPTPSPQPISGALAAAAAAASGDAFPLMGMGMLPSWGAGPMGSGAATPIAASVGGASQLAPQQTPPDVKLGAAASGNSSAAGSKPKDKAAPRKGGLSMFLSGVLDKPVEVLVDKAQPQQPKGPAWGGAGAQPQQAASSAASLRAVLSQEQQQQTAVRTPTSGGAGAAGTARPASSGLVRQTSQPLGPSASSATAVTAAATAATAPMGKPLCLAEFIPTPGSAKAKKKAKAAAEEAAAPKGPAWGASTQVLGSSPPTQLSLRDIQAEQQQRKAKRVSAAAVVAAPRATATRPPAPATGGAPNASPIVMPARPVLPSGTQVFGTSPPSGASPPASKWYVPEGPTQQALNAIQTEEVAIQQLQRLYGTKVTVRRAAA